MTAVSEGYYAGEFLLGEADAARSRANITVASGEDLAAGAVVAPVLAGAVADVGTGDGTVGSLTFGAQALLGDYLLTCAAAGPGVAAAGTGAAVAGNTGAGTITASPATGANAQVGTYMIVCIGVDAGAGEFSVTAPDGTVLGVAVVGSAFSAGGHLTFTIADGDPDFDEGDAFTITVAAANSGTWTVLTPSGLYLPNAYTGVAYTGDHIRCTIADGDTDFVPGDVFTITVTEGSWKELAPAGTDGTQIAKGVLYGPVDASGAAAPGVVITRDAVVQGAKLQWPTGASAGQKAVAVAQLLARGVVVR